MAITVEVINSNKEFVDAYSRNISLLNESSSEAINAHREEAIANFKRLGLPTKRIENYKYTDVKTLFEQGYKKQLLPKKIDFKVEEIFKCDVPELDTDSLLLVNGYYYEKQTYLQEYNDGIIAGSLAAAASRHPQLVQKYYNTAAKNQQEGLTALNTAFAQDGLFIYVPKNAALKLPLQIINLLMSNESLLVQQRNLIILEDNAQADLVICDHTLSPHPFLTNGVTEVFTGKNAQLDIVRMQNEHNESTHLDNTYIKQDRDSRVAFNTATLHGGCMRNNTYVDIDGEGADSQVMGIYISDRSQHIDNYVNIVHNKPNCTSRQLFKGVLDDKATGVFSGKIYVDQQAQRTEAFQTNNNILLTDDAKMKTKPQLEIYADDVKCSHGATVGQLDMDSLFYMRARGIGYDEARLLLMYAFADEVLKHIKQEPLKVRVSELVDKRLRGELSRCNNCVMNCC